MPGWDLLSKLDEANVQTYCLGELMETQYVGILHDCKTFLLRTSRDSWRYWGVERSDWPVHNWIYDYVVMLNP
jgi:hypothetical protein